MAKRYEVTGKVKAVNSLARFLAKRGKGPASELIVEGRSSGERRTAMVTPVETNGMTYVVAPYGAVSWVLNLRANPEVGLARGGATPRFTATEVGANEAVPVLAEYYEQNAKYVAQFMDIPPEPTAEDLAAVADQYPVFRLDPL